MSGFKPKRSFSLSHQIFVICFFDIGSRVVTKPVDTPVNPPYNGASVNAPYDAVSGVN